MAKYSTEFKMKVVNELKINNPSIITRWVKDFREKGIEGLKLKKRGKPPKMLKPTKKSKDIKKDSS